MNEIRGAITGADIADLIEVIYDTVEDSSRWGPVWLRLMALLGAETGCLYLESAPGNETGRSEFLTMPGFSEEALRLYGEYYINTDPYAAYHRFLRTSGAFLSQQVISANKFRETEVWNDYSRRYVGAFHILGAAIDIGNGLFARAAVHRPHDACEFGISELRAYQTLLPHLSRALVLRSRIVNTQEMLGTQRATLDALPSAVMVVDGSARLRFANVAAEELARRGHVRLMRTGIAIRLDSLFATQRLHNLIADAARGGPGGTILHSIEDGTNLLIITISRLPSSYRDNVNFKSEIGFHLALITIRSIGPNTNLNFEVLSEYFRLTEAECDVVKRLSMGESPEEISHNRNISIATTRTHIRNVLSKTGMNNLKNLLFFLGRLDMLAR